MVKSREEEEEEEEESNIGSQGCAAARGRQPKIHFRDKAFPIIYYSILYLKKLQTRSLSVSLYRVLLILKMITAVDMIFKVICSARFRAIVGIRAAWTFFKHYFGFFLIFVAFLTSLTMHF